MHHTDIDRMRDDLLNAAGMTGNLVETQTLHSWELSHVERLALADGTTVIFKCATEPFTHEHEALTAARQAGVSVPRLLRSQRTGTTLAMLMQDLGEPDRQPTDDDGVTAAVQLHSAAVPPHLPPADGAWLTSLPRRALRTLNLLNAQGRWSDTDDITEALRDIDRAAAPRAEGATTAPYGWVHSEFHPESLHIRDDRVHLYDLARAFRGPGLLDLASWHGTVHAPDPERTRALLESYVQAGGSASALTRRGGLTPQDWALGWHRVWVLEWFLAQALVWIGDVTADPAYTTVVRRHTHDAARLLNI